MFYFLYTVTRTLIMLSSEISHSVYGHQKLSVQKFSSFLNILFSCGTFWQFIISSFQITAIEVLVDCPVSTVRQKKKQTFFW